MVASTRLVFGAKENINKTLNSTAPTAAVGKRTGGRSTKEQVKKVSSKRFICPLCIFVATRKKEYFAHFNTYHIEEDVYICSVCPFNDSNKYKFNKHLNEHLYTIYESFKLYVKNRILSCNVCKFATVLEADFFIHKATHIPKDSFNSCGKCQMSYKMKEILDIHQCFVKEKSLSREKTNYSYKKQVVDHAMKDVGPFECRYCPFASCTRKDVLLHELIHADPQKCVCHYCNKDIGSLIKLADHLEIHKREQGMEVIDKKQFSCYICDTLFVDKSELKLHLTSHTVDFKRYRNKPKENCSADLNTKSNFPQVEISNERINMKVFTKPISTIENMVLEPQDSLISSEEQVECSTMSTIDNVSNDEYSKLAICNDINNVMFREEKDTICELVKDEKKEIGKFIYGRNVNNFKNVKGELNNVDKSVTSYSQDEIENLKSIDLETHKKTQDSTLVINSEGSIYEACDRPLLKEVAVLDNNEEATKTNKINETIMEQVQTRPMPSFISNDQIMLNIEGNCDGSAILNSENVFSNIASEDALKSQRDCSSNDVHSSAIDGVTDHLYSPPPKKLKSMETLLSPSTKNNLSKIDDIKPEDTLKSQKDCSSNGVHTGAIDEVTDQLYSPPPKKLKSMETLLSPSTKINLSKIDDLKPVDTLKSQKDCSSNGVHTGAIDQVTDQLYSPPPKKLKTMDTLLSPSIKNDLPKIDDLRLNLEKHVENIIEVKSVWKENEPVGNEDDTKKNYPLGVVQVETTEKQFNSDETKTHACLLGVVFEESSQINEEIDTFVNSNDVIIPFLDPNGICKLNISPNIESDILRLSNEKVSLSIDNHLDLSLIEPNCFSKKVETDDRPILPMSCNSLKNSDISPISNDCCQEELKFKNDSLISCTSLDNSRKTLLTDINRCKSPSSKLSIKNDVDFDSLKVTNLTKIFSNKESNDLDLCANPNLEICEPSRGAPSIPSISKQNYNFVKVKNKENFHPSSEFSDKGLTKNSSFKSPSSKSVLSEINCFSKSSTYVSTSVSPESSVNKVEKSRSISDKHHKINSKRSRKSSFKEIKKSKRNQPSYKALEGSKVVHDTASFNIESTIRKTVHKLALKHINEDVNKIIEKNECELPLFSSKDKQHTKKGKFKKHSSFNGQKNISLNKVGSTKSETCSPKVLYSDKKKLDINKIVSDMPKGMQEEAKKDHHEDELSRKKNKKSKRGKSHHFMKNCSDEIKKSRVEKNKLASSNYYAKQQEFISSLFNKKPLLKMGRIPKKKNGSLSKDDKLSKVCNPVLKDQNSDDFYYLSVAESKPDTINELICSYKIKKPAESKEQIQCLQGVEMEYKTTNTSPSELSLLQNESSSEVDGSKINHKATIDDVSNSLGSLDKETSISFNNENSIATYFGQDDCTKLIPPKSITSPNLSKDIGDVTGQLIENFKPSQKVELQSECEPVSNSSELKLKECSMSILPKLSVDIKLQSVVKEFLSTEANENLQIDNLVAVDDTKGAKEFDTQILEGIKEGNECAIGKSLNINYSSEILCPSPAQNVTPCKSILGSMIDQKETNCLIKENNVDLYDYIDKEVESLINKN